MWGRVPTHPRYYLRAGYRPGATGQGHFGAFSPQIAACAQKQSNKLVPLECISGPVPPQSAACALQAEVKFRSRAKPRVNVIMKT